MNKIGGYFPFNSQVRIGGGIPVIPGMFSLKEIKDEPMFFSADLEFCDKHGGPLTHEFLDMLPPHWRENDVIVDTRVHMLMPGWFPCIPGWHHDDVPRSRSDGQPNYETPEYESEHVMMIINSPGKHLGLPNDIAPTQFALGEITLPDVPLGGVYYREWHPIVQNAVDRGRLKLMEAEAGRLIFFDWQTFHTGQAAKVDGWRWFVRASRKTNRKFANEIRRQVQVYMGNINDGW